jgi:hypothetical protein
VASIVKHDAATAVTQKECRMTPPKTIADRSALLDGSSQPGQGLFKIAHLGCDDAKVQARHGRIAS